MRLVSFDLCPFVQRSTIALNEKDLPHTIEYIDLAAKPAWFLEISPHGRVPLLQVDDTVLFESLAILEYLDETHGDRLHPADPLARARDRAWFPVVDAFFASGYQLCIAPDEDRFAAQLAASRQHMAKLEDQIQGPLWRGDAFTLMDAVAYPGLQRLRWLDRAFGGLGLFDATPRVDRWEAALSDRPSIQRSLLPGMEAKFLGFLQQSPVY
ncbi:MAG: glutathione S-transferase family protein, partial [Myxococcales bacterium]|nr:glutathione S-transferase family protein [Myxococcales bacterium]